MGYKIENLPSYDVGVFSRALIEVSDDGAGSYAMNGNELKTNIVGQHLDFPLKSGVHYPHVPITGSSTSTNTFPGTNTLTCLFTTFAQPVSPDSFSVNVTAAVAGGLMKIVIYRYYQGSNTIQLMGASPDLNCSTTGVKTWVTSGSISFKDTTQIYAIGVIANINTINTTGTPMSLIPSYWPTSVGGSGNVVGFTYFPGSYIAPVSAPVSPNTVLGCPLIYMYIS
jgi:hypothetical protein